MARTSKKKSQGFLNTPATPKQEVITYRAALYARLSTEEGDGANVIETQLQLLRNYVAVRPEIKACASFVDNGFSGTNFNRPGFQSLMEQVRSGEINCLIVKDLSRLGRNYIETGNFIERICPELRLRVISVDEGFDTASDESNSVWAVLAPLINIMNDEYAKDISRKICSVLQGKMERGEYIGNYAPYGYLKDPDDKNHLIPDPELTDTVVRIFRMRADGMGIGSIASALNQEDIPSPGRWRYEHGIITNNNKKGSALLWNRHVLSDMLQNEVYIGNLEQARCRQSLHERQPHRLTQKEEWVRAENTHEGIVPKELFDRVQSVNAAQKAKHQRTKGTLPHLPGAKNLYGSKLVCVDCGATMKLVRSISTKKDKVYFHFKCSSYIEHGAKACTAKKIAQAELDEAVLTTIQTHIQLFLHHSEVLSQMRMHVQQQSDSAQKQNQLRALEKKIQRQKAIRADAYMDWRTGILSEEAFKFNTEACSHEIVVLQRRVAELSAELGVNIPSADQFTHWNLLVSQHKKPSCISRELLDAFIEKIEVSEDKNGIRLDIKLKFMDEFNAAAKAVQQYLEASA